MDDEIETKSTGKSVSEDFSDVLGFDFWWGLDLDTRNSACRKVWAGSTVQEEAEQLIFIYGRRLGRGKETDHD